MKIPLGQKLDKLSDNFPARVKHFYDKVTHTTLLGVQPCLCLIFFQVDVQVKEETGIEQNFSSLKYNL